MDVYGFHNSEVYLTTTSWARGRHLAPGGRHGVSFFRRLSGELRIFATAIAYTTAVAVARAYDTAVFYHRGRSAQLNFPNQLDGAAAANEHPEEAVCSGRGSVRNSISFPIGDNGSGLKSSWRRSDDFDADGTEVWISPLHISSGAAPNLRPCCGRSKYRR